MTLGAGPAAGVLSMARIIAPQRAALTLSARAMIEKEPNYTYVSARLLTDSMRHEALKFLGMPETRYLKALVIRKID